MISTPDVPSDLLCATAHSTGGRLLSVKNIWFVLEPYLWSSYHKRGANSCLRRRVIRKFQTLRALGQCLWSNVSLALIWVGFSLGAKAAGAVDSCPLASLASIFEKGFPPCQADLTSLSVLPPSASAERAALPAARSSGSRQIVALLTPSRRSSHACASLRGRPSWWCRSPRAVLPLKLDCSAWRIRTRRAVAARYIAKLRREALLQRNTSAVLL